MRIVCECEGRWAWEETQKDITWGIERFQKRVKGELMKMEEGRSVEGGL